MQTTLLGLTAIVAFTASARATDDSSWMQLDSEIANLSSTTAAEGGMTIGGYLADWYTSNSDTTPDTGGWAFKSLRLSAKGTVEDMTVKISTDLKSGTAVLKDAFVTWSVSDSFDVTVGQFKRPFSWNFTRSSSRLLFYTNNLNGENEARDIGFMLSGDFSDEMFEWQAAMTNGDDGASDKQRFTGRVVANLAGNGGFHKHEGAIDGRDELDASVGLAYAVDDSTTAGYDKVGLEGAMTMKGFALAFDVVDWSADAPGTVFDGDLGSDLDDTTPFSVTASYLVTEDMELAVRYEDFDDAANSSRMIAGFNFYQVLPHRAKWMLNFQDTTSDTTALEEQLIRVGLVLAF